MARPTKEQQVLRDAQALLDEELAKQAESEERAAAIERALEIVAADKEKREREQAANARVRSWADKVEGVGWTSQDATALERFAVARAKERELDKLIKAARDFGGISEDISEETIEELAEKADAANADGALNPSRLYKFAINQLGGN